MYILGTDRLDNCRPSCGSFVPYCSSNFPKPMSWPSYNRFLFCRIVKTFSQTETTQVEVLFLSLRRMTPAFCIQIYSVSLIKCQIIVSVNLCGFLWAWLFDIVFMIPLLSERAIRYIMYETVRLCLTPFSFPALDGRRPKNCEDFTEMVVVRLLVFMSQCHNIFFTMQINVIYTTNDQFEVPNITVWLQNSHFVSSSPWFECRAG